MKKVILISLVAATVVGGEVFSMDWDTVNAELNERIAAINANNVEIANTLGIYIAPNQINDEEDELNALMDEDEDEEVTLPDNGNTLYAMIALEEDRPVVAAVQPISLGQKISDFFRSAWLSFVSLFW
ncbi:MAG: hypothetical protein LBJ71_01905 [Holosporaceae bacterium]|jgi:hypothetical protein|nr:hypothetical protein [Holosporaceae bacterium]